MGLVDSESTKWDYEIAGRDLDYSRLSKARSFGPLAMFQVRLYYAAVQRIKVASRKEYLREYPEKRISLSSVDFSSTFPGLVITVVSGSSAHPGIDQSIVGSDLDFPVVRYGRLLLSNELSMIAQILREVGFVVYSPEEAAQRESIDESNILLQKLVIEDI